jgi:hypothetical protein
MPVRIDSKVTSVGAFGFACSREAPPREVQAGEVKGVFSLSAQKGTNVPKDAASDPRTFYDDYITQFLGYIGLMTRTNDGEWIPTRRLLNLAADRRMAERKMRTKTTRESVV